MGGRPIRTPEMDTPASPPPKKEGIRGHYNALRRDK